MNHHFWGDISAWFIKCVSGICVNPDCDNLRRIKIAPAFVEALDHASAEHVAPYGKISASWKREGKTVELCVNIPDCASAFAVLPDGFTFEDGAREKAVVSGRYRVVSAL